MKSVVRFRTSQGDYAVPVESARGVRSTSALTALPDPRKGVVGLLDAEGSALTVFAELGTGGNHVLVLADKETTFGLLVDEVLGVTNLDESEIGPPPPGQRSRLVTGVVNSDQGVVLIVDVGALLKKLGR